MFDGVHSATSSFSGFKIYRESKWVSAERRAFCEHEIVDIYGEGQVTVKHVQVVRYSAENHKRRYKPLVDKFKDAFKDEADVWMILNHILNVMLDFAVKVHNDQMPKENNYAEHVFRVIYQSVKQYFRKNEESDS